jgi:hypothetical protein
MNEKPTDNLRILKVATCPSLTRASQITYHLGLKEEDDQNYLRIAGDSGGGLYARECVPLDAIITAIQEQGDHPITGKTLRPLFRSKSANTPGFALAAARDLALIVARPGTDGGYQGGNSQPCREAIAAPYRRRNDHPDQSAPGAIYAPTPFGIQPPSTQSLKHHAGVVSVL